MPKRSSPKRADRIVRRRMADGSIKVYRYPAWAPPKTEAGDTMRGLLRAFEASPEFGRLAVNTQRLYRLTLARVRDQFGKFPVNSLERKHIREVVT